MRRRRSRTRRRRPAARRSKRRASRCRSSSWPRRSSSSSPSCGRASHARERSGATRARSSARHRRKHVSRSTNGYHVTASIRWRFFAKPPTAATPIAPFARSSTPPSAIDSSPSRTRSAAECATSSSPSERNLGGRSHVCKNLQNVPPQSGGFMSKKLLLSLCAAALLTVSAFGQTADELLENNMKAMGGKDKLMAVKSMRMTGKMKMGPMEAPITIIKARPSEMRVDFTIQGMTGTSAYDGKTGWQLMPFMGNKDPQKLTEEQLKDIRVDADFVGPTFDYKAKGNKVEYVGKVDVEGTPTYKLHVTTKEGKESNVYLDAETYLVTRTEGTRNIQGQDMEMESTIGDYKTVDGLTMPYSMESHVKGKDGMGQAITVDKIELNPKVDAAMFAMPAPAAAAKPQE